MGATTRWVQREALDNLQKVAMEQLEGVRIEFRGTLIIRTCRQVPFSGEVPLAHVHSYSVGPLPDIVSNIRARKIDVKVLVTACQVSL